MPTTQLLAHFLSVVGVVLLRCSVVLGLLHVSIHPIDGFISSLVWSIVVVELDLSKHRRYVNGLSEMSTVFQRLLFSVDRSEWLRVLMITGVVNDIYLIFYNNLSLFTWFCAVRWVKTLVETCISTALFVLSLNILKISYFTCERINFSSRCLDHFLCCRLLFFKVHLRYWAGLCLNRVFLLSTDIDLLLWSLMDALAKLIVSQMEYVGFWVVRVVALALILLPTAIWMIGVMCCNSAV